MKVDSFSQLQKNIDTKNVPCFRLYIVHIVFISNVCQTAHEFLELQER